MSICNICPRGCRVPRRESIHGQGAVGYCRTGMLPIVSRAALHHWEEPCISGTRGAGTVFFAGCNLSCVYCQNYEISELRRGIEISVERLAEIYRELIARGAHNIDLVTPTHFTHAVFQSLREPLPVPVVYNCGGYESVHTVAFLRKKIQCWLPDLKYSDAAAAERYSSAPDYFEKAVSAIEQMFRQTGPYEIGADGILKKGVLIRHLILPGQIKNTKGVLEYVAETFRKGDVLFSLMRQYTPHGRAEEFPKSTAGLPMKNTKRRKRTWKRSVLKTAMSSRKNLPIKVLSPFLTGQEWNAPRKGIQKNKASMKNVRRIPRASFDMPFDLKRFLLLQFLHECFFIHKETGVLRLTDGAVFIRGGDGERYFLSADCLYGGSCLDCLSHGGGRVVADGDETAYRSLFRRQAGCKSGDGSLFHKGG